MSKLPDAIRSLLGEEARVPRLRRADLGCDLDRCLDSENGKEMRGEIAVQLTVPQIDRFRDLRVAREGVREWTPRPGYETPVPQYLPLSPDADIATTQLIARMRAGNIYMDDQRYLLKNPSVTQAVMEAVNAQRGSVVAWSSGVRSQRNTDHRSHSRLRSKAGAGAKAGARVGDAGQQHQWGECTACIAGDVIG
jgi:hypothetical protein